MYWIYFKYVIEHKWNVGIECLKMGLFWHAITHDLSKFLPSEFIPYAKHFCAGPNRKLFEIAWCIHQHRNKHHWDYWVKADGNAVPMPRKYVKQMIADWRGMSRKFGDTAVEYYVGNKKRMILHKDTVVIIEDILGNIL